MANASCNVTALTWHRAITRTLFLLLNNTNYTWDPGVLKIKDTMLDKCAVPHQVQFIQHTTELLILTSEDWIQYYAPNGIHFVLHGTSFVLLRTTHSSLDNYFRSFHCQAEYCQMRYVWELLYLCSHLLQPILFSHISVQANGSHSGLKVTSLCSVIWTIVPPFSKPINQVLINPYPCILICGKVMSTSLHIYLLEKTELILEDDFNFP
jgi:hypothetical protein